MNKELFKKINLYLCSILFIYIIFAIGLTTHTIIKNYILAYMLDVFICIEFYWIIKELIKEDDERKKKQ